MSVIIDKLVFENFLDLPALLLKDDNTLTVTSTGMLYAGPSSEHAVGAGQNTTMIIEGDVFAANGSGLFSEDGGHTVTISATGSVIGANSGIRFEGDGSTITNAGEVIGNLTPGIHTLGSNNVITNTGTVRSGGSHGIHAGTAATVTNSGLIESADTQGPGLTLNGQVTNSGTIQGFNGVQFMSGPAMNTVINGATGVIVGTVGVFGSGASEVVTNNGSIIGDSVAVHLYDGNDVYNGQGGGVANGAVWGGSGNDTLLGGAAYEEFRGHDGNDILNGGGGADFLDGAAGNDTYQLGADASDTIGDASGTDTVTSTITRSLGTWAFMENLILQGAAAIDGTGNALGNSIVGNGMNNTLAGQGGNDVLVGAGGNDLLYGQAGKDSLTGSTGNDAFVFQAVEHTAAGLGDVIVDFDDFGDDLIDLTGIAGLTTYQGMNAFTAPGQVRIQQMGGDVIVEINTAGNGIAEGEIIILNATIGLGAGQVSGGDFLW